jgi:hypothetical protein
MSLYATSAKANVMMIPVAILLRMILLMLPVLSSVDELPTLGALLIEALAVIVHDKESLVCYPRMSLIEHGDVTFVTFEYELGIDGVPDVPTSSEGAAADRNAE